VSRNRFPLPGVIHMNPRTMNITNFTRLLGGGRHATRRGRNGRAVLRRARPQVEPLEQISLLSSLTQTFSAVVPLTTTELNTSVMLPKFNSALGTLNSVTLDWAANGTASGTVTNNAAQAQTFTVTDNSVVTLSGVSPALSPTLNASQTYTNLA